ncbi:MAG: hypothetical protein AUG51_18170 [Acidobacteria bacterium 13_1_20CM_3_53_8]|nr:MAG: hypothetical protein AUG51_18170 [Acidobacteria bacterium 13_1_20CM_3_53_8]
MSTRQSALVWLFAATLILSAALLFWVEPMVGKMLLPLLGGTPAVWNTCLLFFQTALLAGYAYALVASKWLTALQQKYVQLALLALAFTSLPIYISNATANSVPVEGNPVFWLLGRLIVTVGLPFFILAANSTLLQNWFAATELARARDPYFLYAASNAGSLLGLIAYPALLEPRFTLGRQSKLWTLGYFLVVALVALCAFTVRRSRNTEKQRVTDKGQPASDAAQSENDEGQVAKDDRQLITEDEPLTLRRRMRWMALAFVPSSLMLGVTTYISADIASIPLLWVTPLALYLLTLVIAFAPRKLLRTLSLTRILPGMTIVLLLVYLSGATQPIALLILLHLLYLFVAALTYHTLLADDRPHAANLAEFYLWLSTGGALGGLFNALLAPAIFNSVIEYPLMILLACLLLPRENWQDERASARRLDLALPVGIGLLTLGLAWVARRFNLEYIEAFALYAGAPLLIAYQFRHSPFRFTLSLAAIILCALFLTRTDAYTLASERNFFGVLHATRDERNTIHRLYNGITLHGSQYTDLQRQCEPLSYYTSEGPLGQIIYAFQSQSISGNVAVIGLGTGATIAYSRASEQWTFYEINPAVVRIARAPEYFTYLSNCAHAPTQIVLGDARLQLKRTHDGEYGLIILDAFSSDAIPVHLMTEQALDLYLSKLAPGGLLGFHISNRSLDLHTVVANLARSRNLICLSRDDTQPSQTMGKEASQWVIMARRTEDLGTLANDSRWQMLAGDASRHVWTDDFSNIISIFKWH